MLLADEARSYFEGRARVDRDALDPWMRVGFSCESLKVTTRLMHVIAWLLARRAVAEGELPLDALADAPAGQVESALLARRGVGPWTAHYVMLRGYGLADCLPLGDAGLTLALQRFFDLPARPGTAETRALMAPFAPFRSLATFHLWTSLGDLP